MSFLFIRLGLLFLLLPLVAFARGEHVNIEKSIASGEQFLIQTAKLDQLGLLCASNNSALSCSVSGMGKLFSAYFIVNALGDKLPEMLQHKFLTLIQNEKKDGRWGYSSNSPVDADDSSFALQTLLLLHQPYQRDVLDVFYKKKEHAYTTFITDQDAEPVVSISEVNNKGIHPEVNANIYNLFHALKLDDKINFALMNSFQNKLGYWESYFYPGKYYSTYFHLKLLCVARPHSMQVARGLDFILASQHKNGAWGAPGNTYDTALALNSLIGCQQVSTSAVKRGVNYLLRSQNKKGYWQSSNVIWSYLYRNYPETIWSAYDNQHVVTTALVLQALKGYVGGQHLSR